MDETKKETKLTLLSMGRLLLAFAGGFLAGRVRVADNIWPFGTAFVATAFLRHEYVNPYMALAGVLTALVTYLPDMDNGAFNFATVALASAILIVAQAAKAPRGRVLMITAIGAAYLVSTVAFRLTLVMTWLATGIEMVSCIAVAVLCDIAAGTLGDVGRRRVFSEEELISVVFLLIMMVMGIGGVNIAGVYLRRAVVVYICLMTAYIAGGGSAAAAGIAMAMATVISGEAPIYMAETGFAAMSAGAMRKLGRAGTTVGFMIADATMVLFIEGGDGAWQALIATAIACAAFIATPKKAVDSVSSFLDETVLKRCATELHDELFRRSAKQNIDQVATAMSGAAKLINETARPNSDSISYMISSIPAEACSNCMLIKNCWDTCFEDSYAMMQKLYAVYKKSGHVTGRDADPDFAAKCLHLPKVMEAANGVFCEYAKNRMWEERIRESRAVLAQELTGAAGAMRRLSLEIDKKTEFVADAEDRVRVMLDREGIFTREVAVGAEPFTVEVVTKGCGGRGECRGKLTEVVGAACGKKLAIADGSCTYKGGGLCRVAFRERKAYKVDTSVALVTKSGSKVSGDAHSVMTLPDGRVMLLLSDGMGSGEKAARESNGAVGLVEDLYRAGFMDRDIIPAVNKLMMLASSDDIYTTIDRCMVNCDTGRVTFTKIAAARSFMIRGDDVKAVRGGALPLGVMQECVPKSCGTQAEDGDMIVMATDGVTEPLGGEARKIIGEAAKAGNPKKMAEAIMGKALEKTDGVARDDMTLIVARIKKAV